MLHTLYVGFIGLRALTMIYSECIIRVILINLFTDVALKFVYGLSMADKTTKSLKLTTLAYSLIISIHTSNSISMVGMLGNVHTVYRTSTLGI